MTWSFRFSFRWHEVSHTESPLEEWEFRVGNEPTHLYFNVRDLTRRKGGTQFMFGGKRILATHNSTLAKLQFCCLASINLISDHSPSKQTTLKKKAWYFPKETKPTGRWCFLWIQHLDACPKASHCTSPVEGRRSKTYVVFYCLLQFVEQQTNVSATDLILVSLQQSVWKIILSSGIILLAHAALTYF